MTQSACGSIPRNDFSPLAQVARDGLGQRNLRGDVVW